MNEPFRWRRSSAHWIGSLERFEKIVAHGSREWGGEPEGELLTDQESGVLLLKAHTRHLRRSNLLTT